MIKYQYELGKYSQEDTVMQFSGKKSGAGRPEKHAVKVLIVPKFEIDKIEGGFPGEAQFFYGHYCAGCKEISIPHSPPSAHFYL